MLGEVVTGITEIVAFADWSITLGQWGPRGVRHPIFCAKRARESWFWLL